METKGIGMAKRPKHMMRTAHLPQNIRVEEVLREALDKYAEDKNVPVSTAVHDIVADALIQAGYLAVEKVEVKPPVEEVRYSLPGQKSE